MKAVSCLKDSRIGAFNVLFEVSIADYVELVSPVLKKNEFQRRRVSSSKTVYSLLRHDLRRECVIPPVVLALTAQDGDLNVGELAQFETFLQANKESLVILDGLQRTYTIIDLVNELKDRGDFDGLNEVLSFKMRMEIYFGINRLGILYRMLTLNTGQTPMSLRQQIEILYLDYINVDVAGVELIRETASKPAINKGQYNFKDVVEGFNAYLERDELPIDKADILENINSLEKLAKEDQSNELFEKYVKSYSKFVDVIDQPGLELDEDYLERNSSPFGRTPLQIFKKPQALSGFGAAVGKLIDFELISNFDSVYELVSKVEVESPAFLEDLNNSLEWLKDNAKKIGNAQRSFFCFYFRELLNAEGDAFLDLSEASKVALRKYQAQNM